MTATVITSGHSDLRPGMTGEVLHPHADGWAILFLNTSNKFASSEPRNIIAWCGANEVELSPNDPFPEAVARLQLCLPLLMP